jgi:hypothetical protein
VGKFVTIGSNKCQLTFAHQFLVLSDKHSSCSKVQSIDLAVKAIAKKPNVEDDNLDRYGII